MQYASWLRGLINIIHPGPIHQGGVGDIKAGRDEVQAGAVLHQRLDFGAVGVQFALARAFGAAQFRPGFKLYPFCQRSPRDHTGCWLGCGRVPP